MSDKIKIMVSSTVKDMEGERDCIQSLFQNSPLFEIIGANPYNNTSHPSSPVINTINMANECDIYILILGEKYGFQIKSGKSATELEFDTAYRQDPTKVLIFLKKGNPEPNQKLFIDKVCQYYSGYWRVEFDYTFQLQDYVNESVLTWIKDRASLNKRVSYCEHFIREAIRIKPTPECNVYYSVQEKDIEIEYQAMSESHSVQFARSKVFADFWGCLYHLQEDLERWCSSW